VAVLVSAPSKTNSQEQNTKPLHTTSIGATHVNDQTQAVDTCSQCPQEGIIMTTTIPGDTAAEEARSRRLNILKGLHGAWMEYPDDGDGSVLKFVLLDTDDDQGF
jgi:hypothetical protein